MSLLVGHCVPLLVGHCVRLVSSPFCFLLSPFLSPLLSPFLLVVVSALSSFFPLHMPLLSPSRLQPFTFVSQLLCPAILYICLPALGCVSLAIVYICLPALTAVSASALQSFTCVLASLCICLPALDCCIRLCLAILYLSPSSALHVVCNPLHLSPCVYICLPALDSALQFFVSQLWTSQALVAECADFEKHKLFGVYGGI